VAEDALSAQLSTALGLGIRELVHALVLVMSGAATVALTFVGAARGRWRFLRRLLGTVSAGPWARPPRAGPSGLCAGSRGRRR
jgi:hypothetical protein